MKRLLLVFVVGCHRDAEPGIALRSTGSGPEIAFLNCSDSSQQLALENMEIRQRGTAVVTDYECVLLPKSAPAFPASWMYGTPLEGYGVRGCGPLQRGNTYEIVGTFSRNRVARASFAVEPDGHVRQISGGCD